MDKVYVGNGKEITTKYGELLKISFSKDDLDKMYENLNEKGWINLNVSRRKSVSQYGHTHSVCVDDYDKNKQQTSQPQGEYQPDAMAGETYGLKPHPQAQSDYNALVANSTPVQQQPPLTDRDGNPDNIPF